MLDCPTKDQIVFCNSLQFDWYVIPLLLLLLGALMSPRWINSEKLGYAWPISYMGHNTCNPVIRLGDTVQIIDRWQRPVASSEALDPVKLGRMDVHSIVINDSQSS